ncbi:LEM-3-like GIY-YIG domain-containing protein [Flavobacterium anhuiense]|uniref:LEM-3-like GIY-YIG domain-containing protein n=1 Tax=Flavobacterium anhuiense TaxID=459526 RepID=UPI003D9734E2
MNNFEITEFPPEVAAELNYYVYRLIDPRNGETFYIGKGKGNRIFEHLKGSITTDENEDSIDLKLQRIRNIQKTGLQVIHIIHRHGLDSDTAFHVEAALIDAFPGTTNLAGGRYSNDVGPMNSYEILQRYKAETADLMHKIIMISINRSVNDNDIYDAVRFAWKLDPKRAQKAEYVLAVEKGIIVGVFKAENWYLAELPNQTSKRYGFNGQQAPRDIQGLYLRKRIPEEYRKKGASNPVKYNFKKL